MLTNILTIINIQVSIRINGFLYFLKKLPLIKKLLKNTNYSFLKIKRFITWISVPYKLISKFISTGILFFAAIYLPITIVGKGENLINQILFLIFSFNFLLVFLNSEIMEAQEEKMILVKQMKMHPKDYSLAKVTLNKTIDLVGRTLVYMLVFKYLLQSNPILGLKISLSIVGFSIFVEAMHLYIYNKYRFSINKKTGFQITAFLLIIILSYIAVIFTKIPESLYIIRFFNSTAFTIFISILGILGYIYLYKYNNYWNIINEQNTIANFENINEIVKESNFSDVKMKDKDFQGEILNKVDDEEREGYSYLNYMFFERHKRIVYKPMIKKSLVILGAFILLFIANTFFLRDLGEKVVNIIITRYTFFIFIMYLLCDSNKIIRSIFYNCDRSLLRFGFYKKGNALLKMFSLRLRKIIYSNEVPTIVMSLCIILITYIYSPNRIIEIVPILLLINVLSLFFSVHYIFLYYIFQPFTTSLQIKNPFYGIINWIVYFLSYIFLRLKTSPKVILPIAIVFSLLYTIMAITLVYKIAPKTFRAK